MGQYGEFEIQIVCKSDESAEKVASQLELFNEYVASKTVGDFHADLGDIHVDGVYIEVNICSDRGQNAKWQTQHLFSMCKELCKGEFHTFTAEYSAPQNLIYQEFDDEGEEI